jgi:hypothetical protein
VKRLAVFLITLAAGFAMAHSAQAGNWDSSFAVSPAADGKAKVDGVSVIPFDNGRFVYVWMNDDQYAPGIRTRVAYPDGTLGPVKTLVGGWAYSRPQFMEAGGTDSKNRVLFSYANTQCCTTSYSLNIGQVDDNGDWVGDDNPPYHVIDSSNSNSEQIYNPDLSVAPDGSAMAVWSHSGSSGLTLWAAEVAPGENPTVYPVIGPGTSFDNPTIAAKSGGGGFFAATQYDAPFLTGVMIPPGGPDESTHFEQLASGASGGGKLHSVIDSNGKTTVLFRQQIGPNDDLYMRQVDPGGIPIGAGPTLVREFGTDFSDESSQLIMGPDNEPIATWTQHDSTSGHNLGYLSRISSEGVPQPVVTVSDTDVNSDTPRILFGLSTGPVAFLRVFSDAGNGVQIRAQTLTTGGGLSPSGSPRVLANYTTDYPGDLMIAPALSETGDATVAWRSVVQEQNYSSQVDAAVFDATGPDLSLTIPAKTTQGFETTMAAHTADRSNPVSLNWDFGDGGTSSNQNFANHSYENPGTYTVTVTATDDFDNQTVKTAQIEVVKEPDLTLPPTPVAPNASITFAPLLKTKATTATYKFISDQAGSKFECKLDKAGWTDCKSPLKLKKLKPGKHTFKVRATKGDMIDQSPATRSWTVQKKKKKKQKK